MEETVTRTINLRESKDVISVNSQLKGVISGESREFEATLKAIDEEESGTGQGEERQEKQGEIVQERVQTIDLNQLSQNNFTVSKDHLQATLSGRSKQLSRNSSR